MSEKMVIDFDDLEDKWASSLNYLYEIKKKHPNFKVTLFTVVNRSSREILRELKSLKWIELAIHGWNHTPDEWRWDEKTATYYLRKALESGYFVKGFKAPNWRYSNGTLKALGEMGFWAAFRHKNEVPKGLRYYSLDKEEGIEKYHGHLSNTCGNYIGLVQPKISAGTDFLFVSEIVKENR